MLLRHVQKPGRGTANLVAKQRCEERLAREPPTLARAGGRLFDPPDDARHERLRRRAVKLLDLHCEHFHVAHLHVEELHHPLEGVGDVVCYEQQPKHGRRSALGVRPRSRRVPPPSAQAHLPQPWCRCVRSRACRAAYLPRGNTLNGQGRTVSRPSTLGRWEGPAPESLSLCVLRRATAANRHRAGAGAAAQADRRRRAGVRARRLHPGPGPQRPRARTVSRPSTFGRWEGPAPESLSLCVLRRATAANRHRAGAGASATASRKVAGCDRVPPRVDGRFLKGQQPTDG